MIAMRSERCRRASIWNKYRLGSGEWSVGIRLTNAPIISSRVPVESVLLLLRSQVSSPFRPSSARPGRDIQCAMLRSVFRRHVSPSRPRFLLLTSPNGTHSTRALATCSLVSNPERAAALASYTHHHRHDHGMSSQVQRSPAASESLKGLGRNSLVLGASTPRYATPVNRSPGNLRTFHSTPRNEINPVGLLIGLLKVSISHN